MDQAGSYPLGSPERAYSLRTRPRAGNSLWHDGPVPAPQYCPSARELDDLELLVTGALTPLRTFEQDGPVRLSLPDDLAQAAEVELVDPEGFPLALLTDAGLSPLGTPSHGPFRRLHLDPGTVRERHPDAVTVPVAAPLTLNDLDTIRAQSAGRPVVLLALVGTGTPQGVTGAGLVRATLAAARLLDDAHVVAVPLPSHGDPTVDHELGQRVAANFAKY